MNTKQLPIIGQRDKTTLIEAIIEKLPIFSVAYLASLDQAMAEYLQQLALHGQQHPEPSQSVQPAGNQEP